MSVAAPLLNADLKIVSNKNLIENIQSSISLSSIGNTAAGDKSVKSRTSKRVEKVMN